MPASLTLDETLSCSGDECGHSSVAAVRIGSAIFQYLPECIYFHFHEGLPIRTSGRSVTKGAGFCVAGGARLWDGRVELDTNNVGDSVQRQAECLTKCEAFGGTGCELVTAQSWGNGCVWTHTRGRFSWQRACFTLVLDVLRKRCSRCWICWIVVRCWTSEFALQFWCGDQKLR